VKNTFDKKKWKGEFISNNNQKKIEKISMMTKQKISKSFDKKKESADKSFCKLIWYAIKSPFKLRKDLLTIRDRFQIIFIITAGIYFVLCIGVWVISWKSLTWSEFITICNPSNQTRSLFYLTIFLI
jgi:hypothetical protein